jgi:Mrp family chromosome partitioning ATPase
MTKKIVVFHSAAGGAGKSTLIASVAVALMQAGRGLSWSMRTSTSPASTPCSV